MTIEASNIQMAEPAVRTEHPRRVLVVSANIGEGHNSAGRALQEAVQRIWPGCTVDWVDTLDVMGRWIGPLFRGAYAANVEHLPWLYEFFYNSLWRVRPFATAAKKLVGGWCGPRLARVIDQFAPDVILSTYPLGSAGLEWVRWHRDLTVPVGAWICDFAPHPFWVYEALDLNLVMHPIALADAHRAEPHAALRVSAPVVSSAFTPGDRTAARAKLDLPDQAYLAVVSCGSFGFGEAESTVRELLEAGPDVYVLVVCGRNEALRREMVGLADRDARLHPLGWVRDMPSLLVASDVVVTNAGGATALEALACERSLVLHRPIAAHGKANAAMLAQAGLATISQRPGELTDAVRRLRDSPAQSAVETYARERDVEDGIQALWSAPPRRSGPLRPADALFLNVHTPQEPQHVGAVIVLEQRPDGSPPSRKEMAALLGSIPGVRSRVVPSTWRRRARWEPDEHRDPYGLVDEVALSDPSEFSTVIDSFFAEPLAAEAQTGAGLLVGGLAGGRSALLVKLHHCIGDGVAALGGLLAYTSGRTTRTPGTGPPRRDVRTVVNDMATTARGLWALARRGSAGQSTLDQGSPGTGRAHHLIDLPARELRRAARAMGAKPHEVVLTLFAEALHRSLSLEGGDVPSELRVMTPWSRRRRSNLRSPGNHTGAVPVRLPTGPMTLRTRLQEIRQSLRHDVAAGMPDAAQFVVRLIGYLPPTLAGWLGRQVYRSRWFDGFATFIPGPARPVSLAGAEVAAVYPVLSLAPGVGLAWGALTWGDTVTVCYTTGRGVEQKLGDLSDHLQGAFDDLARTG